MPVSGVVRQFRIYVHTKFIFVSIPTNWIWCRRKTPVSQMQTKASSRTFSIFEKRNIFILCWLNRVRSYETCVVQTLGHSRREIKVSLLNARDNCSRRNRNWTMEVLDFGSWSEKRMTSAEIFPFSGPEHSSDDDIADTHTHTPSAARI